MTSWIPTERFGLLAVQGNYNDYRNLVHCFRYFKKYKDFIRGLIDSGMGDMVLKALTDYINETYYREELGQKFYYSLQSFSGALYNIYTEPGLSGTPWKSLRKWLRFCAGCFRIRLLSDVFFYEHQNKSGHQQQCRQPDRTFSQLYAQKRARCRPGGKNQDYKIVMPAFS